MERSNIIMDSYPQWVKFIKALNKEAFWRYEASIACNNKAWRSKYTELRVRLLYFFSSKKHLKIARGTRVTGDRIYGRSRGGLVFGDAL
jgi:hypothetical protein